MIITQNFTYPAGYYLYTYANQKVKKIKEMSYFAGGEPLCVYPKKHILEATEGDSWDTDRVYYKVNHKKMKVVAREKGGKYYLNGKRVSVEKFGAYVNSIQATKKYDFESGVYKFRKNTKKNRNKYIR